MWRIRKHRYRARSQWFNNPVVEDTTICEGESVTLMAESNANILWYDINGQEVGQGENFTTIL